MRAEAAEKGKREEVKGKTRSVSLLVSSFVFRLPFVL